MAETMAKAWEGFVGGAWEKTIDVRDFIQKNYTPYEGDESFLAGPTESTTKLWSEVMDLFQKERENGGVLVTLCSACYHVIKRVNYDMATNVEIRQKVNNYLQLEEPYAGETRVLHYLEVLRDEIGWEKLAQLVSHPLKERKVGAYYGCLLLRPGAVLALDDVESPTVMEAFIKALGAEPVIYSMRNECCGGYLALKDKAQCEQLVSEIKNNAASCGAQELVTACPLCAYNLTANGAAGSLPTRYFTELLAEALGVAESEGGAE